MHSIVHYTRSHHSKYRLVIHLIFVVKYRKKLLTKLGHDIKDQIKIIESYSDFEVVNIEVDKDHLHMMISYPPRISVLQIVRRLKVSTTKYIWKLHNNYLTSYFWNERTFWSDGYYVSSIGDASIETVKHYIESQG